MYSYNHRQPDIYRIPPTASRYANTPEILRLTEANKYTKPTQNGFKDYMRFTDDRPHRDKYIRSDIEISSIKKIDYHCGATRPAYRASTELPRWRQEYHRNDETACQAKRNLAFYRTNYTLQNPHLYAYSNQMTSTQYKKPLNALYGPLLREKTIGINYSNNRHGFALTTDYYA